MTISKELLNSWVSTDEINMRVQNRLSSITTDNEIFYFMLAYASWNGRFANGVSALASLIGEQKNLFIDSSVPKVVGDRSNFIASYIFDAARDEYDDHIQKHRDTHRCLGQATVMGIASFCNIDLNTVTEPAWITFFNQKVLEGYTGKRLVHCNDSCLPMERLHQLFAGIGYHLGSELLADREFSIIDSTFRSRWNDLTQYLLRYSVKFGGGSHRGYAWIGIHSGENEGGGVEDDHFNYALDGVNKALEYVAEHQRDACIRSLRQGFEQFNDDHMFFFLRAGNVIE